MYLSGTPNSGIRFHSDSFASSLDSFSPFGLPGPICKLWFWLVLLNLGLFFGGLSLMAPCSFMKSNEGVCLGEREYVKVRISGEKGKGDFCFIVLEEKLF